MVQGIQISKSKFPPFHHISAINMQGNSLLAKAAMWLENYLHFCDPQPNSRLPLPPQTNAVVPHLPLYLAQGLATYDPWAGSDLQSLFNLASRISAAFWWQRALPGWWGEAVNMWTVLEVASAQSQVLLKVFLH